MIRHLSICICLALLPAAVRAANRPHAAADSQTMNVWTNDDLEKLHDLRVISIVGQDDQQKSTSESAPQGHEATQNPEWYAEQASQLRDELEHRRVQLHEYQKALEDAQSLRATTGGINLIDENLAITPEAGVEILQQRVTEVQKKLDDLEDLARRSGIKPGTLRGQ